MNPLLVAQILGHSPLAMIQKVYAHLTVADASTAMMKALRPGANSGTDSANYDAGSMNLLLTRGSLVSIAAIFGRRISCGWPTVRAPSEPIIWLLLPG